MKFIGTKAECLAFKKGVEHADSSGELTYGEPTPRPDLGEGVYQIDYTEDDGDGFDEDDFDDPLEGDLLGGNDAGFCI